MKTTKTGRCNQFSTIWAAIYGCTGDGVYIGMTAGNFSRRVPSYECPACNVVRMADKANPQGRAQRMACAQAAAGIADYRYARARWVDGRPVIG